jgi:hypothetical protein
MGPDGAPRASSDIGAERRARVIHVDTGFLGSNLGAATTWTRMAVDGKA